ncbi:type I polyketide synthase [Pusillimonas sp. ANT_WB101]|uniref:type I polyketide synthase n=1 Tax=Pusillimonas sp. ANT_WB101 TaxID=2597356 RepID=UPI0011ECB1C3|nr:type I polyketide synthase [Pusillimonas sp. ANT_WB101]KAA0911383.1 SDR family NAD(P)-dependent oxidoreductase [Pusillimonas sp. ANT_WB101]
MGKRVAVVGMSFRLPDTDSANYWPDMLSGKDLVTHVDPRRWEPDAYLHPGKSHPGTSYTFAAGSIGDVSAFDPEFFGISPREAANMDPQQRLLLELCWEAIENAGVPPSHLQGSNTGVYVGISADDYLNRIVDDLGAADSSTATGNTSSIAANRLSYAFDLCGPSMAIDTACSSSLVAFHQACLSIVSGETSMAIAGGISLHLHPFGFIGFSKATMLSPNGRCRAFDADGDGYVRSEGGGLFLLKDYDLAVADGDRILAIVAGSAVNTDGNKTGLTVPKCTRQSDLMRVAMARAGISPDEIDYVEAHGTGTAVGDPIETRAIGMAMGMARSVGPLPIGSVKSNMGHLETASGVASLVKAIYSMHYRMVPATIGVKTPNPQIKLDDWNLQIVTENLPLKPKGRLTIGINSFGFGGANAHVLLQSADPHNSVIAGEPAYALRPAEVPVLVSARSDESLKGNAAALADFLRRFPKTDLYDVATHAALRREWHDKRAMVFATSVEDVVDALQAFADSETGEAPGVVTETALVNKKGPVFVYSGNGSQWEGMGPRLLKNPVFAKAIDEVDALFQPRAGYSLRDELLVNCKPGRYAHTDAAQPALFALQVGITQMLRARGVTPSAVVGHSVGEVAAAWACGALTLTQAVRVIFERSRLQETTKGHGQMTAAAISATAAAELLSQLPADTLACVAGYNSPNGCTLAGSPEGLSTVEQALAAKKVRFKRLDLDYAFHSPAMDPTEAELLQVLASLKPSTTSIPMMSTVTGQPITGEQLDATYWWQNIRFPVLFEQALDALVSDGSNLFVEIGPHAVLAGYVRDTLRGHDKEGRVLTTLKRRHDEPKLVFDAADKILLSGEASDWDGFFPVAGRFIALPHYVWQKDSYWHAVTPDAMGLLYRRKVHYLLGYPVAQHEGEWENQLDTLLYPTLADHAVGGAVLFPGAGFAEIFLACALQTYPGSYAEIEELDIANPLLLAAEPSKRVRTRREAHDGRMLIHSKPVNSTEGWTLHASARILQEPGALLLNDGLLAVPERAADCSAAQHYAMARAVGLEYGEAYQAVEDIWALDATTVLASLVVPACIANEVEQGHLHPALLDAAFQLVVQLLKTETQAERPVAMVPVKVERLALRTDAGVPRYVRAHITTRGPRSLKADFSLYDAEGRQVAALRGARFRSVMLQKHAALALDYLDYVPVPRPLVHGDAVSVCVDENGLALAQALSALAAKTHDSDAYARYAHELDPLLDSLAARYALRALTALADDNRLLSATTVEALTRTVPPAGPVLDFLLAQAVQAGEADVVEAGWKLAEPDVDTPPEDIWNALLRDYPDYAPLIFAVGRTGTHLASLLVGETTWDAVRPRELSGASMLRQVVGDDQQASLAGLLHDAISATQRALPVGKRLGVLEISTGEPLFAADCGGVVDFGQTDYDFASTNADAIDAAHGLQEQFPDLTLTRIDGSGGGQMQTGAVADLVLLAGDFESAEAAHAALDYATARSAPDAQLLFIGMHTSYWNDLVLGGTHAESAPAGDGITGLQPPAFWQAALAQHGWSDVQVLEFAEGIESGPYVLMARTAMTTQSVSGTVALSTTPSTWLVLADEQGPSALLAHALESRLTAQQQKLVLMPAQNADSLASLINGLSHDQAPLAHIVLLAGLGCDSSQTHGSIVLQQTDRCALVAAAAQACESTGATPTIWVIGSQATAGFMPVGNPKHDSLDALSDAAVWGFARSLMNEASGFAVRAVDLPALADVSVDTLAGYLLEEFGANDAEQEIIRTPDGARFAPRLRELPAPQPISASISTGKDQAASVSTVASAATSKSVASAGAAAGTAFTENTETSCRLGFEFSGQLRNLRWEAVRLPAPSDEELEVDVEATGLNFRDVMYTMGMLSDEAVENGYAGPSLGLEFAGTVRRVGAGVAGFKPGDRVLGFGPHSFGTRTLTRSVAVAHVPEGMSAEAAATIPSTFFTVYYALQHLARLEPGERILIHGAAGGVGIAAIQLARHMGAEIYVTAGSDEKRDFLRLLGLTNIYDSRSLSFADEILADTGGEGVDVVINSLAGEAINRNLRVLKPFGRFLELGKRDFYENTRIGLRPFRNNISYFGIDADQLMQVRPDLTRRLFRQMVELFAEGALTPLPFKTFDANNVIDAFRYMQQARQIGKIVVTYHHPLRQIHRARAAVVPGLSLPADASYLVTGGMGGFGLRTAQWLVEKGARHLVLLSRRGATTDEAREAIAGLESQGVQVLAAACDVTNKAQLAAVINDAAASMPVLKGIVHAATVIDDGLVRGMTPEQIQRVLEPKMMGALHLHTLTLDLPLDFFVLYSSATTVFGNPGQSNYVAANSWLEALAGYRRGQGLPATCARWGAIDDVGFLARNEKIKETLQNRMGGAALPSATALKALERMLQANRSGLAVMEFDWQALQRFMPVAGTPKFSELARRYSGQQHDDEGGEHFAELLETLDEESLQLHVQEVIKGELSDILRLPVARIDASKSVYDMGLDSLLGVELMLALESRFGVRLPVMTLGETPTIAGLADKLISKLRGDEPAADEGGAVQKQASHLLNQHVMRMSDDDMQQFAEDLESNLTDDKRRIIQ